MSLWPTKHSGKKISIELKLKDVYSFLKINKITIISHTTNIIIRKTLLKLMTPNSVIHTETKFVGFMIPLVYKVRKVNSKLYFKLSL